jgi:hypothetical protein
MARKLVPQVRKAELARKKAKSKSWSRIFPNTL